jgi:hypothetical protein
MMFWKLDLFPSSGEREENTPTQFGPLERANLNHWMLVLYTIVRTLQNLPSKTLLTTCFLLLGCLLRLLFNSEEGCSTFLWDISEFLRDYTKSHLRRQYYSSYSLFCFWTLSTILFLFKTRNISETAFCLHLQVEPTKLGPVDRASPYLQTPAPTQYRIYIYIYDMVYAVHHVYISYLVYGLCCAWFIYRILCWCWSSEIGTSSCRLGLTE